MLRQINEKTTLLEFFRMLLEGARHVDANEVSFTAAASTATQRARHGLGRAYRAGLFCGRDAAGVGAEVLLPTAGPEPQTYVYFQLRAATATSGKLLVW